MHVPISLHVCTDFIACINRIKVVDRCKYGERKSFIFGLARCYVIMFLGVGSFCFHILWEDVLQKNFKHLQHIICTIIHFQKPARWQKSNRLEKEMLIVEVWRIESLKFNDESWDSVPCQAKNETFLLRERGGLMIDSKSHVRFSEKACPFLGNRTCDLEKRDMRFLGWHKCMYILGTRMTMNFHE